MTTGSKSSTDQGSQGRAFRSASGREAFWLEMLERLDGTREQSQAREMMGLLAPALLEQWAGRTPSRRLLAGLGARMIRKASAGPRAPSTEGGEAPSVFDDPAVAAGLVQRLPDLIGLGLDAAGRVSSALSRLPADERTRLLAGLFKGLDGAALGDWLTAQVRLLNEARRHDPSFMAESLGAELEALIDHTDFGELKEWSGGAAEDAVALAGRLNDLMTRRPGKMILLSSLQVTALNVVLACLRDLAVRSNEMGPDLTAEVLLAQMTEVDGKALGGLINEGCELIRKVHAGSALMGEPGHPLFVRVLSDKLDEVLGGLDAKRLGQARQALAEDREAIERVVLDQLRRRPELVIDALGTLARPANARWRSRNARLGMVGDLPGDEGLRELARGLGEIDPQELAETLNLTTGLAGRIREQSPDLFGNMVEQFSGGLDLYGLHDAVDGLFEDVERSAKPLARALLPVLLKGLCRWLAEEDDEWQDQVGEALDDLRTLLAGDGETP